MSVCGVSREVRYKNLLWRPRKLVRGWHPRWRGKEVQTNIGVLQEQEKTSVAGAQETG